jgi:hypothetical protein
MSTQLLGLRPQRIRVPADARTFDGFRRWMRSPESPTAGRFAFLDDTVLADMSPEELETHNKIKTEVSPGDREPEPRARQRHFPW